MDVVIDIISHMRKLEGTFPKREQRVANYLLANLEGVAHLSQSQIAEATDVSVATVNRFCRTLGCEGFREFKIRLAQSVAVSLQYLNSNSTELTEITPAGWASLRGVDRNAEPGARSVAKRSDRSSD